MTATEGRIKPQCISDDVRAIEEALAAGPSAGIWTADVPNAHEHPYARFAKVYAPNWGIVAHVNIDTSLPNWDGPQRANANFIAAAHPARLRRVLDTMQALAQALEAFPDEPNPFTYRAARMKARAALALYEGKQ